MNQRIKLLAKQAGLYHTIGDNNFYPTNLTTDEADPTYQKFAELIVKECAHLVGGYTKENEFGTDVKEAYEEITKHFGVEE
jgi:hypothetical protein